MRHYKDKLERRNTIGWTSRTAVQLRRSATQSEIVFRIKLLDAGFFKFRFQKWWILENDIFITDFFIWKKGIVIEVDGPYHFNSGQMKKDARRDALLLKEKDVKGILRISDDQAYYLKPDEIKKIINSIGHKEILSLC